MPAVAQKALLKNMRFLTGQYRQSTFASIAVPTVLQYLALSMPVVVQKARLIPISLILALKRQNMSVCIAEPSVLQ
jgi:hypothetical protein